MAALSFRLFSRSSTRLLPQLQHVSRYSFICHNVSSVPETITKKSVIVGNHRQQIYSPRVFHRFNSSSEISTEVGTEELEKLLENGQVQLIDVREPEELTETGQIPSSVNIPLGSLDEVLQLSPDDFQSTFSVKKPELTDTDIVFYCKLGKRSRVAMEIAIQHGYTHVRHFYPGMDGWLEK